MRAFVRYNSRNERGTLDWLDPAVVARGRRRRSATCATSSRSQQRGRGCRTGLPPRRADRDPVLVRQPARLRRDERARHAQRRRRRRCADGVQRVVHTSTSEVYGTRRSGPDHRGRTRSSRSRRTRRARSAPTSSIDSLPPLVRAAGRPSLRPFNTYGPHQSRARRDPDDHLARRSPAGRSGSASLTPRRDLTYVARHRRGLPRGGRRAPARSAARSSSAPATTSRSATSSSMVGDVLGRDARGRARRVPRAPGAVEVERLISRPVAGGASSRAGEPQVDAARRARARRSHWIERTRRRYRTDHYVI